MPKGYREYLPEQDLLLPPSLRDWLPENHLVYFVSDVVDQLDLSPVHAVYEKENRGQPPYDPRLMTKLLGRVHTTRRASTISANERNPRKRTSSFSKRERILRNPLSLRKGRSISLRFL